EQRVKERTAQLEAANRDLAGSVQQLKELESRLALSDRLASVGTLAAGVAHEINNPLAFAIGNVSWVEGQLAQPPGERDLPELRQALAEVQTGLDRIKRIVQDLKQFSRPDESSERDMVDV